MSLFDDLFGLPFGGSFDINHDGKTDFFESSLGFKILDDLAKKDKEKRSSSYNSNYNSYYGNTDISNSGSLFCNKDTEYGLDYDNFDCEDDYLKDDEEDDESYGSLCSFDDFSDCVFEDNYGYGSEETENFENGDVVTLPVSLSVSFNEDNDTYDEIKPEKFPNIRKYDAAVFLKRIEEGTAFISTDSSAEAEKEKCNFILHSPTVAGNYLTIFNGFLYTQAVKENFKLPIDFPEEDENIVTEFDVMFSEVAEEDVQLALDIWVWCIKEFGPYKKYTNSQWTLFSSVIYAIDDYPAEFLDNAIKELGSNKEFCKGAFTDISDPPYKIHKFIVRALELGLNSQARAIFSAITANSVITSKKLTNLIEEIVSGCSNYNELETMENFKFNIIPVIEKITNKRVIRLLPEFKENVDKYIDYVESSNPKYSYCRKYAWRKKYRDVSQFRIDPLNFKTEEEYNQAIYNAKYGWRRRYTDAELYGLNVNDFETEAKYKEVLFKKIDEMKSKRFSPTPTQTDFSDLTDKTVYNFCSVLFESQTRPYSYLTGEFSVKVGDRVIVPIGNNAKEKVATVVSTFQCLKEFAPFPVEKAKKIIGIFKPNEDNGTND